MFSLIGLCLLAAYPVMNSDKGENGYKALHRAEGLAYQLIEIHKNLNIPTKGRSIASLQAEMPQTPHRGEIGVDPWGRAYQFEVLQNKGHRKSQIVVWSLGENGQSESKQNKFDGDDIGVTVEVR